MNVVVAEERISRKRKGYFPGGLNRNHRLTRDGKSPLPLLCFGDRQKLSCLSAKMTNDKSDPAFQISRQKIWGLESHSGERINCHDDE